MLNLAIKLFFWLETIEEDMYNAEYGILYCLKQQPSISALTFKLPVAEETFSDFIIVRHFPHNFS